MGRDALLEALESKGENRALALWKEAEREAEHLRTHHAEQIQQLRKQADDRKARLKEAAGHDLMLQAQRQARQIRTEAQVQLEHRLYPLALSLLPRFRSQEYDALFAALVSEVPPRSWAQVRVSPSDTKLAAKHFPSADVVPDTSIQSGFEALTEGNQLHIVNSLEKRLERAWPDLLPKLLEQLSAKGGRHDASG